MSDSLVNSVLRVLERALRRIRLVIHFALNSRPKSTEHDHDIWNPTASLDRLPKRLFWCCDNTTLMKKQSE